MRRIRFSLLACALFLPLVACSVQPSLSASSGDELSTSLKKYVSSDSTVSRKDRQSAADTIQRIYLSKGDLKRQLPAGIPSADVMLAKLPYNEVAFVAARLDKWVKQGGMFVATELPAETPTERIWRNKFLVDQLKSQIAILDAKRDNARYKDLFTVDQFRVTDSSYIPPQPGVPLGQDVATFTASFDNAAMFGVYSLGFHVVIKDPASPGALVDEVMHYNAVKDPILVGETRQIAVTCCDSYGNERLNRQLRDLPLDAQIDMNLVEVTDFTKKNRLEGASFSSEESLRLFASKACLQDLESRLPVWSPSNAVVACDKY